MMMQVIAPVGHRAARSTKLVDTALATIDLLDELLAVEFTLIADPEAYAPLAVIARWWQPSSYPSTLVDGLRGIVRKLISAIRLRARTEGRALEDFVQGPDVWAKWDAARRLMAARQMQSAATNEGFQNSFRQLGRSAISGEGTDQLLAVALIVRVSELVKGELRKQAADILSEALRSPIDGLWTVSETKNLPLESKPSEIRENIALALSHASGPWLVPYVIEALAREEKSVRCRLELARQLSQREPGVARWFNMLSSFSWLDVWDVETADRIGRLRELSIAFATTIHENRNTLVAFACECRTGIDLSAAQIWKYTLQRVWLSTSNEIKIVQRVSFTLISKEKSGRTNVGALRKQA
jgi:hypothetical protein